MRIAILSLLIVASAATARADVGPSFLQPAPSIEITIENAADFADYDFYVKCGCGPGNPYASPQRIKFEDCVAHISGGRGHRVTPVYLLAAPRGAELPGPADDREWLTAAEEGCLQSEALEGGRQSGTHAYRISIEDAKLKAKLVASDAAAASQPVGFTIAAGLAGALGLVTLPLILLRRRAQMRRSDEAELAKAER